MTCSAAVLVMPPCDYAALSDADLASIYAYVRSVPPVARHTPPAKFGPKAPAAFDATPAVRPAYGVHLSGSTPNTVYHAPNLSLIIPLWTTAGFFAAIRTGMTPGGSKLSDDMPWRVYASMSDDELHAILAYLRTIPPRAAGM